jgi:hypothetical protein
MPKGGIPGGRFRRRFVSALLCGLSFFCSARELPARCTARLVTSSAKIRPYSLLPPAIGSLLCARNETCSFQVVVTAEGDGCRINGIEVHEPASGGAPSDRISFRKYRQAMLHVFYTSNEEGDTGEWPDPLIPEFSPVAPEKLNALPFELSIISPVYRRYLERGGRAVPSPRGAGEIHAGGGYSGSRALRFIARIVQGGPAGEATFEWSSNVEPQKHGPIKTSSHPIVLSQGITLQFHAGRSHRPVQQDFMGGEEFWFYAAPERHQAFWVDAQVPEKAAPGRIKTEVRIAIRGQEELRLPLELEVLHFSLPATSSLPSWFGANAADLYRAHHGRSGTGAQAAELARLYALAGLENGITVDVTRGMGPKVIVRPDDTLDESDLLRYEKFAAPLLKGEGTPRGARWTSLRVPTFGELKGAAFRRAVKRFVAFARDAGAADRLFDFTFDEPRTGQHVRALRARAAEMRAAAPEVPRLVTTPLDESLIGIVTRWCPVMNTFGAPAGSLTEVMRQSRAPTRTGYDSRLAAGDSLWWYQSCMSHGCAASGRGPRWTRWPSLMVDTSAAANRVQGLLSAFTYEIGGVLYWRVNHAMTQSQQSADMPDAWTSVFYFGGNGDGSLFYPGRPQQVGGTHHFPVESLRLKQLRSAFYDAEYAYALRRMGENEFLRREVEQVITSVQDWHSDARLWDALREHLLRRIEERTTGH